MKTCNIYSSVSWGIWCKVMNYGHYWFLPELLLWAASLCLICTPCPFWPTSVSSTFFRLDMWKHVACLSVPDLFHLIQRPLSSFILLQASGSPFSESQNSIPLCAYVMFSCPFIHGCTPRLILYVGHREQSCYLWADIDSLHLFNLFCIHNQ